MAGQGFRTFVSGEVLTAANVQGYLMEQSVMAFTSASARDVAIASPSAGMFAYLTNEDALYYYNGSASAWAPFSAGAKGGGQDQVFYENDQIVTTSYTLSASVNAMSAGPITIANGASVTIPSGAVWVVV